MGGCYAYYRLPDDICYSIIRSADAVAAVNGEWGDLLANCKGGAFLIAPFQEGRTTPTVLIPATSHDTFPVPKSDSQMRPGDMKCNVETEPDGDYEESFRLFHDSVASGQFSKLVLSRSKVTGLGTENLKSIFFTACRTYPHLMVSLFSTPQTGTWLIASPEPLVEITDGQGRTAAIAGTMTQEQAWSAKNRQEQQIVEDFIKDSLSGYDLRTEGPYNYKAGSLVHLRTDITFDVQGAGLKELTDLLHPTPAVCGLPREDAVKFILDNEGISRRYYSGFAGPAGIDGKTALYVSLRCAEIIEDRHCAILHAGGGIMPQSDCRSEFEETEHKMQTIAKCIAIN